MKRIYLLFTVLVAFSIGAQAQATFSHVTGKDTVTGTTGGTLILHNQIKNISSSTLNFNWRIVDSYFGAGFSLESFCDNNLCYYTAGGSAGNPLNPLNSFDGIPLDPDSVGEMKATFINNNAPLGSYAYITLSERDKGSVYAKNSTYIAYASTSGVKNIVRNGEQVTIFPNPLSGGTLNVIYDPSLKVKSIGVYNVIGKMVAYYKTSANNSAKLTDLEKLSGGVYFLRMMNSEGQVVATKKFTAN